MTKIGGVLKKFGELCEFHRKLRACKAKEKFNKSLRRTRQETATRLSAAIR